MAGDDPFDAQRLRELDLANEPAEPVPIDIARSSCTIVTRRTA